MVGGGDLCAYARAFMSEQRKSPEQGASSRDERPGAHAIRARFLAFFAERGHVVVPSSSLVPRNDPSLKFVNAGMVQFKNVFTGRETRDFVRATSSQRCLRAGGKHNDLDNVGFTPRHHTLFEMLGNFSFGDYFKAEAIEYAWEFLTKDLKIPAERLVVSVYNGKGETVPFDQEAHDLWKRYLPEDRIYACHAKENFWQMGDTGPCGPCSEIHIYNGAQAPGNAKRGGKFGPEFEDTLYTELWNLVFMQYEKREDGSMTPLPKPCVDTGAGLERLAAVVAGVDSNYKTELLKPFVDRAKSLAGVAGDQGEKESSFQVIADHARATAFLIADRVFPEKTDKEYVLRRIMRRAIRHGSEVGLDRLFFHEVCQEVVDRFGDVYPELRESAATIEDQVKTEERNFRRTLSQGIKRVTAILTDLDPKESVFPAAAAADLYSTYGFPIDLTGVMVAEKGLTLDEAESQRIVHQGSEQENAGKAGTVGDVYFEVQECLDSEPEFVGYDTETVLAKVIAIVAGGRSVERCAADDSATIELVFDRTPFYAESGGQVGDSGTVSGRGLALRIVDTQKPAGRHFFHRAKLQRGSLVLGDSMMLQVDALRRAAIRRNHSATHLLHHALRAVLGDHVMQKGSLVTADRLRFDFSHGAPLSGAEKREVERRVNLEIMKNGRCGTREMSLAAAKHAGAIGLFDDKYGDRVRVVSIGGESVELCGGTHVGQTGEIGFFATLSEVGVAQGVRRLEAVTGEAALVRVQEMSEVLLQAEVALNARGLEDVIPRLEKLQKDLRVHAKAVEVLERKLVTGASDGGDLVLDVGGVRLMTRNVGQAGPKVMRAAADTLRDRLKSGVVVLACERDGKCTLLVAVTRDLTNRVHAGKLVSVLARHIDGRGGGRPDMAQAGGPKVSGIGPALAAAKDALRELLR